MRSSQRVEIRARCDNLRARLQETSDGYRYRKIFNGDKGYGFIAPDQGGEDVFVHATALPQGSSLKDGDKVIFDIGQDRRTGKTRAENVRVS